MLETALMANLAAWANIPPEPEGGIRSLSQEEKLEHLKHWQPILGVRKKIVAAFRPREGETDVFIHLWEGDRLSYPGCKIEQLLSEEEIDLLDEDDPMLELIEGGWISALIILAEISGIT